MRDQQRQRDSLAQDSSSARGHYGCRSLTSHGRVKGPRGYIRQERRPLDKNANTMNGIVIRRSPARAAVEESAVVPPSHGRGGCGQPGPSCPSWTWSVRRVGRTLAGHLYLTGLDPRRLNWGPWCPTENRESVRKSGGLISRGGFWAVDPACGERRPWEITAGSLVSSSGSSGQKQRCITRLSSFQSSTRPRQPSPCTPQW